MSVTITVTCPHCGHKNQKLSTVIGKETSCYDCKETWVVEDVRRCRVCGCTEEDCSGCIERTGQPCHWIEDDLCSACEGKG